MGNTHPKKLREQLEEINNDIDGQVHNINLEELQNANNSVDIPENKLKNRRFLAKYLRQEQV